MLRIVLSAIVAVDVLSFYFFLGDARTVALAKGVPLGTFSEVLSRPFVRGTVVAIGLGAVLAFGRRAGRLLAGSIALGVLGLLSSAHTMLFGSPWRHLFFGGACLLGWLIGLAVRRHQGAPRDESLATIGSTAILGATYFNAGISKVVYGGLTWLSPLPVQYAVVAQSGMVTGDVFGAYRAWVVATPVAAAVLSAVTVAFELAGPLMLVGRRTRACVACGLVGMHANIYFLTTHILYWESMVLLLAVGLAPAPASQETAPRRTGWLSDDRRYLAAVAALAACASVAIGHQAVRYARRHSSTAEGPRSPAPALASPAAVLRRVGPFTVGETIVPAWTIAALQSREDGLVLTLAGEPGRIRFDITCASASESPFDVGDAHVLYWKDLPFEQLEAAGRAVQGALRTATGGHDVCAQLSSWRTAAEIGLTN